MTKRTFRFTWVSVAFMLALAFTVSNSALAKSPACSAVLGIEAHGQHVVGDYVTGMHGYLTWPPAGMVGEAVKGQGAVLPGGPGFHFPNNVAPGASFCIAQAQSPGFHVGQ
jgi:hypothetical protein